MPERNAHALVSVPVAELRRNPSHGSELLTQVLMGESLDIIGRTANRKWLRVRRWDGYRGWIRAWSVTAVPAAASRAWLKGLSVQVVARSAQVLTTPGARGSVAYELPIGTRLRARSTKGDWLRVLLPGNASGWVTRRLLDAVPGRPCAPARVVSAASRFLGAPYLWGGVTSWGCDCSGLVQSVFRSCGVDLPRDAREQFGALGPNLVDSRAGRFRPGDLLFFGAGGKPVSHVAISTGGTAFIHAYGYVREGNLAEGRPHFVPELARIFRAAARPLDGQKKG